MTLTLEQKIESALAAQQKVEELRHLEAQAAELPQLLEQQRNLEWIESVRPAVEKAKTDAATLLQDATPKMQAWQKNFVETYLQLEALLLEELPQIKQSIDQAAKLTQQAVETEQRIAQVQGRLVDADDLSNEGFLSLWTQLGGTSPDLAPLPGMELINSGLHHEDLRRLPDVRFRVQKLEKVVELITKKAAGIVLYYPAVSYKRYS